MCIRDSHRLASYSVQSQRYVREDKFEFVTPPKIADNEQAKKEFDDAMENAQKAYDKISNILKKSEMDKLISEGVDEKSAEKAAEKAVLEDARFVLPNACDTKMIVTMNARSLYNFFAHRCCMRAQWEIRAVADEMLKLVKGVCPQLFKNAGPACVRGKCSEGKMSCGMAEIQREKFSKFGE